MMVKGWTWFSLVNFQLWTYQSFFYFCLMFWFDVFFPTIYQLGNVVKRHGFVLHFPSKYKSEILGQLPIIAKTIWIVDLHHTLSKSHSKCPKQSVNRSFCNTNTHLLANGDLATFWLYQHRVRNAYFQRCSQNKFQILIWVTLYEFTIFQKRKQPPPKHILALPT